MTCLHCCPLNREMMKNLLVKRGNNRLPCLPCLPERETRTTRELNIFLKSNNSRSWEETTGP